MGDMELLRRKAHLSSGGSDMGWGFLTMTAADYREAELAEGGCTCDECEYAYHGVGEMDDDSFAVEPWSEHVFCALRRAMVLETHRPCADWIG